MFCVVTKAPPCCHQTLRTHWPRPKVTCALHSYDQIHSCVRISGCLSLSSPAQNVMQQKDVRVRSVRDASKSLCLWNPAGRSTVPLDRSLSAPDLVDSPSSSHAERYKAGRTSPRPLADPLARSISLDSFARRYAAGPCGSLSMRRYSSETSLLEVTECLYHVLIAKLAKLKATLPLTHPNRAKNVNRACS